MMVSPSALAFTVQLGSASVPSIQDVSITGISSQLNYSSVISTSSGGNWLVVENPTTGSTVGTLQVGVANFSTLQPGTYSGAINVSSQAANSPQVVQATLTVLATPSLTIAPQKFAVSEWLSAVSNVTRQTIQVSAGAGALSFGAVVATAFGGNWLAVTPQSETTPASLTVSVDDAGLSIGTYTGTITITPASGAAQTVTITLNVISPAALSATPAPIYFAYPLPLPTSIVVPSGSQPPAAQSVTVSNKGTAPLSVSIAIAESGYPLPASDNGTWLFASPGSGTTRFTLSVSVNPSGLAYGTYNGTIIVPASDDSVTPLAIPVTLNVTASRPIDACDQWCKLRAGRGGAWRDRYHFRFRSQPFCGSSGRHRPDPSQSRRHQRFFRLVLRADPLHIRQPGIRVGSLRTRWSDVNQRICVRRDKWNRFEAHASDSYQCGTRYFRNHRSGRYRRFRDQWRDTGLGGQHHATGEGQTNPAGVDGSINGGTLPLPAPFLPVSVEIGGLPAVVDYAGGVPLEVAGLLQVNVTIPAAVATGPRIPVVITVGTATSQTGVTIAIKP